jgi:hypothetical protein
MRKRLAKFPLIPEEPRLSLDRVAGRWRMPVAFARIELQKAGIELVYIERTPIKGARLSDILRYEDRLRAKGAAS